MKKNILFVIYSLNSGGAEHALVELLKNIDRDKYDISLLVMSGKGVLLPRVPKDINIIPREKSLCFLTSNDKKELIKSFSFRAFFARMFYSLNKIKLSNGSDYRVCQQKWMSAYKPAVSSIKEKYDIAVAYMHSLPSYYVIDKVNADRKILWVHNDYKNIVGDHEFDYEYYKKADSIVTISNECVNSLKETFADLSNKIICLPNIVDSDLVKQKATKFYPEEFNNYEGLKLVSVGRLSDQKRFDRAIAAAKILKDKGIEFKWLILGTGVLLNDLSAQITDLNLSENVLLVGLKSNPYPYLGYADIVVQTSDFEGKSIVIDEAKILAKPIVSTNYNSACDQINDGVTGVLTGFNPEDVADGIIKLANDDSLKNSIIENLKLQKDETKTVLDEHYRCFNNE